MTMTLPMICGLYGISCGLLCFILGARPKGSMLIQEDNEWLTQNFFSKLYVAVFGNTDPVKICKMFGLEYDKYMRDCNIIGRTPDFPREAMMRVIGVFAFFACIPLSIVFYSPVPLVCGCVTYLALCSMVVRGVHREAEKKKADLLSEMPRYVDLLLSALEINLPIEIAILQTADNVPSILSTELKTTFAETSLGAKNWQQALEAIAHKYEIDQLSDFVLNIITAYNKGVSVTDAVAKESLAVRQSALLIAKEKTAKMTSTILFPLLVFKILPLIVLLLTPIMITASSFYG